MRSSRRALLLIAVIVVSLLAPLRHTDQLAAAAACPSFTALPAVAMPALTERVVVGDFTGHGRADVVAANMSLTLNKVSVLANDGAGHLGPPNNISAGDPPDSLGQDAITAGDFNEDGKLDIAVTKLWEKTLTVLLGDGAGNFTPAPTTANYTTGTFPFDVVAADLDADGHLDLAVANFNSSNVSLLFGDGTGHFSEPNPPVTV